MLRRAQDDDLAGDDAPLALRRRAPLVQLKDEDRSSIVDGEDSSSDSDAGTPQIPPSAGEQDMWKDPSLQQRIIEQSGILRSPAPVGLGEWMGDTALIVLTLCFMHACMEYVVYMQYRMEMEWTWRALLGRQCHLFPALSLVVGLATWPRISWHGGLPQTLLALGALGLGCTLVHMSQAMETFGTMLQTPGLAVLWIFAIFRADLPYACASLVGTFAYYHSPSLLALFSPTPMTP
jgi:hypothetical protein